MNDWQRRIATTRALVESFHPTPSFQDCMAYAVTEAAEALDAIMRLERAGDDRTRPHAAKDSLGRELAQTAEMLGTAANLVGHDLGPLGRSIDAYPASKQDAIAVAVAMIRSVIWAYNGGGVSAMKDALLMAHALAHRYGLDVAAELDAWLDELRERRPAWVQAQIPEVAPDLPLFAIYAGVA